VVVHDYPPHALRLPPAWTILAGVDGDSGKLRANLDRLLEVARKELQNGGSMRLRRDDDGVWYLYVGLNGPALAVTDRWLLVSFSPEAVRQNIAFLQLGSSPISARAAPAHDHP